jgi:predicted CopG family antitoxin
MPKVIKVNDGNYKQLLSILHELELTENERASFDDVISLLINEHKERLISSTK